MIADKKEKKQSLTCPYCDGEIKESDAPFCQPCQITIFYCPKCRKSLPRENMVCPHCGAEIKG